MGPRKANKVWERQCFVLEALVECPHPPTSGFLWPLYPLLRAPFISGTRDKLRTIYSLPSFHIPITSPPLLPTSNLL